MDEAHLDRVSQYTWTVLKIGERQYAQAWNKGIGGHPILLHRFILNLDFGDPRQVDHINRNGLDCRDSNMRIATSSQNHMNQPKFTGTYSSRYKGVSWNKQREKWEVYIQVDYKKIRLGFFNIEEDAARAYDKAAIEHYGEFAILNFP